MERQSCSTEGEGCPLQLTSWLVCVVVVVVFAYFIKKVSSSDSGPEQIQLLTEHLLASSVSQENSICSSGESQRTAVALGSIISIHTHTRLSHAYVDGC